MKKTILLIIAITLFSCSSPLDKKIGMFEYSDVVKEIKSRNTDYSEKDFKTAGKIVEKYAFKAMSTDQKELDVTYRDILEEAKQANKQYQLELAAYNEKLQELTNVFETKITKASYQKNQGNMAAVYPHGYAYDFTILTKGEKPVAAIKGWIKLMNENDEILTSIRLDYSHDFPLDKELKAEDLKLLDEKDNITELKALPFRAIKQVWQPELIIFKDGTRLEAPTVPIDPSASFL